MRLLQSKVNTKTQGIKQGTDARQTPSKHKRVVDSRVIARWAEAPIKIARMTLTIKLDGNWSSFQLANSAPPLSATDSALAPSASKPEAGSSGKSSFL